MKSSKALLFLTLAAALSCGANGSPTNVTTDGYPTTPSTAVLEDVMNSLQDIADVYFKQYGTDYAKFTKTYVNRLAWVRPYNYVVCSVNVAHMYTFDGLMAQNWDSRQISAPEKDTVFEVVVGGSGKYILEGKGGYENWAWNGFVAKNQDKESKVITFVKPPTGIQADGGGPGGG